MTIENLREMIKSTKSTEWLDLITEYFDIKRDPLKKLCSEALKHIDDKSETKYGKQLIEWANQQGVNLSLDKIKGELYQPIPIRGPGHKREQARKIISWLKAIPVWKPERPVSPHYNGLPTLPTLKGWLGPQGYNLFKTPMRNRPTFERRLQLLLKEYVTKHGKKLYEAEVRKSDPVEGADPPYKERKRRGNKA